MSTVVAGVVLSTDWSAPMQGVSVYAYSIEGFTEGSATTDYEGYFVISGLTDREWVAKLSGGTTGNILLLPTVPATFFTEHSDILGVSSDQHHTEDHINRHHTGGADALSLGLLAGTVAESGHGDQGTSTSALHAIIGDADADTLIQLEESSDEDIIRLDTGGTERATLDSTGLSLAVPLYLTEQAEAGTDVAGRAQLWVKTGSPNTLWITNENGQDFPIPSTWTGIDDTNHLRVDSEWEIFPGDYARYTEDGLEGRNPTEVLEDLSGQADDPFDWNDQELRKIRTLEAKYLTLEEIPAPGGNPTANTGWLYTKDDSGVSGLYFEADDGTVTDLLSGGGGGGQDLATDTLWAAQGDLVKGTGDDGADILSIGADHTILVSNGTDPSWSAKPPLAGIADTGDTERLTLAAASPHFKVTGQSQFTDNLGYNTPPIADNGLLMAPPASSGAGSSVSYINIGATYTPGHISVLYGVFGAPTFSMSNAANSGFLGLRFAGQVSGGGASATLAGGAKGMGAQLSLLNATVTQSEVVSLDVMGLVLGQNNTITDSYGIRIGDAAGAGWPDKTTTSYAIHIADQTGGSTSHGLYIVDADDYSIWVDAGLSRFDGDGTNVFELPADATDPTSGGGAATGRIPVKIGGSTVYLAYY
jgi:hypothetical protein